MPSKTAWFIEKRVMFSQARGDMTHEDILELLNTLGELIKEGSPPMHLIQDRRFIGEPYTSFKEAGKAVRALQNMGGWFLVIDQGRSTPALNFITNIIMQAVGVKTHGAFPDFVSLWAFLVAKDPSLPANPQPPPDDWYEIEE